MTEEAFLKIGLEKSVVQNCLKNKDTTEQLRQTIELSGLAECGKAVGNLLYSIATRLATSVAQYRPLLAQLVGQGKVLHAGQLDCCLEYLKDLEARHQPFDREAFDKHCGIGVVLTRQQVKEHIVARLASSVETLKEQRYGFNRMPLMQTAKEGIAFVEGKVFVQEFNSFILEVLGPETEEDKKARQKGKEKGAVKAVDDLMPRDLAEANNSKELVEKRDGEFGSIVLTRFPPEPNGYLHIGHAKAIRFNFEVAKKHGGKCYLRFDDTNPDRECQQYIDMIKRNVAFLGYEPWKVTYASDNFDRIYEYAEKLIQLGHAFVCHENQQLQREKRRKGEPSAFRERPPEESLALFRDMRAGKLKEGEACLRAKIDFAHPNTTMRDPVIYRIKFKPHPHCGDKWCIYPMYDFTHPLCDSIEGISHSLCTLEFEIRRELYYWPLHKLNLYRPLVWEYSRLNITHTLLSKRKIQYLVDNKLVEGWDDPRLLTLQGMIRRGYTADAIKAFCEEVSVTRRGNENIIGLELLQRVLTRDLDARSPRCLAVVDPVPLHIAGLTAPQTVTCPLFPKHPEKGSYQLTLAGEVLVSSSDVRLEDSPNFKGAAPGKLVGLKYSLVVRVTEVLREGENIVGVKAELAEGKPQSFINWLSKEDARPAEFRLYDKLFLVKNPSEESEEKLVELLNPKSLVVKRGVVFKGLKEERVQFERVGYFVREGKAEGQVWNRTISLGGQQPK